MPGRQADGRTSGHLKLVLHEAAVQAAHEERASMVPGDDALQHALGRHAHWRVVHLRKAHCQLAVRGHQQRLAGAHCGAVGQLGCLGRKRGASHAFSPRKGAR